MLTEGASYARRDIANMQNVNKWLELQTCCLVSRFLIKLEVSETDRTAWQCEALEVLGKAGKKMHRKDSKVLYNLSLENAELKNNLLLFMQ